MLTTSTAFGNINIYLLCLLAASSFKIIFINAEGPCEANEIWTNCLHNVCGARTCDEMGYLKRCTINKTTECIGGCICAEQHLRNSKNQCVPIDQCPSCAGDLNATSGTGRHCGNLCSNYNQIYVFCLEKPIEHTCECRSGYVFNDRIGKCVRPEDCPKPCKGDHYAEEKVCAAQNQPTCQKPQVAKSNVCRPAGSCGCIFPYVLHKPGGKCVRYDTCQGDFSLEDFFPTEAPSTTTYAINQLISPSGLTGAELLALIKVHTRVVRGKDWRHGDEDGGPGAQGTVIREPLSGYVKVKWDNGKINSYAMGDGHDYELDLAAHYTEPNTPTTMKPLMVGSDGYLASQFTLDARVVRGKDWTYGNEDGGMGSQGTVVRALLDGLVRVEWDSGKTNTYNMGSNGKYELAPANTVNRIVTTSTLSGKQVVALMRLGSRVVRGRDWKYGDQDGGMGSQGTIVNEPTNGWVRVEWDTGRTNSYRMGSDEKYELDLVNPSSLS